MEKAQYRNALRSKSLIRAAFLQLLEQKELHQIKAMEVIELANISKGTFYAHYKNLYSLLEEIENDCLTEMFQIFDQPSPQAPPAETEDFYEFFLCGLKPIERQPELFRFLFKPGYGDPFLNKVKQTFYDRMMASSFYTRRCGSHDRAKAYLTYVAGGSIMLIQVWIQRGCLASAEEMARFLNACALTGMGEKGKSVWLDTE